MRTFRAAVAALAVLAAGALCVAAGRLGWEPAWRAWTLAGLGVAAFVLLVVVVPLAGLGDGEFGWTFAWPAIAFVACAIWCTVADREVHHGRWSTAVLQEEQCVRQDGGGCFWQYRLTDATTEAAYGWDGCDGRHEVGSQVRVRIVPDGHTAARMEGCAFTSPGWTVAQRIALGGFGLWAVVVFRLARHELA